MLKTSATNLHEKLQNRETIIIRYARVIKSRKKKKKAGKHENELRKFHFEAKVSQQLIVIRFERSP